MAYFILLLSFARAFGSEDALEADTAKAMFSDTRKAFNRRSQPEVYLRRMRIKSVTGQH